MVPVFGDRHMRKKPRAGAPLLDREGRKIGDQDPFFAVPARVFASHMLLHVEACRNVFQFLRDLLVDPLAFLAASGTDEFFLRRRIFDPLPRKVFRKRGPSVSLLFRFLRLLEVDHRPVGGLDVFGFNRLFRLLE